MDSLALGLALGLGAGVSPGPLLALVLTTALRSGTRAGLAVAAAPLVTDVPVVAVSLLAVGAQAAAINLASPHPWVFWLTVGAPLLVTAWRSNPPSAVAFVAGFYACLVGAKLVLATVVGTTRHRLPAHWLRRALVAAGVLLAAAGAALVAEFAGAAVR